jgi:protein-disulfide isomerase
MRRYLPFVIVATVAIVTVGSAMMLYRAKQRPVLTITQDQKESQKKGADSVHARGGLDAPVTLEEYGDFECPPCGKLSEPINQLEKEYRPNLRIIFRNFPLVNHAHAREAAIAAEAAGMQERFWEMHDLLYREQLVWTKSNDVRTLFNGYAGMIGLDLDRFKKDMEGDKAKARVDADQKQGASLGIQNTPTIFVNNRAIDPKSLNPESLRAAIDAAVKAKSPAH